MTTEQFADRCKATAAELRGQANRRFLAVARQVIVGDIRANVFGAGADPQGRPWPPLAFARPSGAGLPLRDKGLLAASVTGQGAGHVESMTDTELTIGTNRPGAALHQWGGTVTPKGHPFLAIPKTVAAASVPSPRQFPDKLFGIYGKRGGVLIDKATGVVQYALTRFVRIPARAFLGFGPRLVGKLKDAALDFYGKLLGGG